MQKIVILLVMLYSSLESRIAVAKAVFSKKKTFFIASKFDLKLMNKVVQCYVWSIALYGDENLTLRKIDEKYLESF